MLKWISISTLILHEKYISKCSVTSNSHLSGRPDFSRSARATASHLLHVLQLERNFRFEGKGRFFGEESSTNRSNVRSNFARSCWPRRRSLLPRKRRWTDRKRGKRTPVGMEWGNCGRRRKSRVSPDGSVGPRVDTVARSRLEPSCLRFSKFRKIMRLSSNDNSSIDNFIPFDDFRLLSSSGIFNEWK